MSMGSQGQSALAQGEVILFKNHLRVLTYLFTVTAESFTLSEGEDFA